MADGKRMRTVKLTVRTTQTKIYGDGAEQAEYVSPVPDATDDPFDGLPEPPEDIEDAVIRRIEEAERDEYEAESGTFEMVTSAVFSAENGEIAFSWEESEATGMEGTHTTVSFREDEPGSVAVARTGAVESVLVLEEGRRHVTAYETPVMPFEISVFTRRARNTVSPVTGKGEMFFDYIVEVRGMDASRTVLSIKSE